MRTLRTGFTVPAANVADILGMSKATLHNMCKTGKITIATPKGRGYAFPVEALRAAITANGGSTTNGHTPPQPYSALPEHLTVEQAAALLGAKPWQVRKMFTKGELEGRKETSTGPGTGRVLITLASVERWLAVRQQERRQLQEQAESLRATLVAIEEQLTQLR